MTSSAAENILFWALWMATVVVIAHQLVRAAASRDRILGYMPPFCMMFAYFYVVQAAIVAINLSDRVSAEHLALGQFVALACLVGCILGWNKGSAGSTKTDPNDRTDENPQTLWYLAIATILVALVGQYTFLTSGSFQGGVSAESGGYSQASGYWYMLFHVAYPGLAIGVSLVSRRPEFRTGGPTLVLIVLSAMLMVPWIIAARRGPLFPFVVVVIYSYYLMRPRLVNRVVVIGGLALAGMAMLLLVSVRDYSTSGFMKFNEDRLKKATALDIITGKAYEEGDNEYLYHCVCVAAALESDRYQWGTSYLSLATHWIPRSWWADKPALAQGWLDPLTKEEIFELTGVYLTTGAASGGVAETFMEGAWFTPLIWYGIGWGIGRVYLYGRRHPSRFGPIVYVGTVAGSHWLISQGFAAAFVPIAVYVTVPVLIFAVATRRRQIAPQKRIVRPHPAAAVAMR